jgi:hypothetical protein
MMSQSQTLEHKIVRIDAALESLHKERSRCTDPADILRVSESIDLRLDERLRLMRDRDGRSPANSARRRGY